MLLNNDFTARAVVHADAMPWVPSPTGGVDRRMLFRIGDEKARATSIVRYAPGSQFPAHGHPGGEEILVLDGVFQDESGDYPVGSYMRNPPGTHHTPASAPGCVIFVKLWQFRKDDDALVALRIADTPAASWPGVAASHKLFDNGHEEVRIEKWQRDATIDIANSKGLELLVLEGSFTGSFTDGTELLERHTWLRLPPGQHLKARTGDRGARIWLKAGALLQDNICEF
jgi:quercetin dioxygenase-like cupin family protein